MLHRELLVSTLYLIIACALIDSKQLIKLVIVALTSWRLLSARETSSREASTEEPFEVRTAG
jgi:hypothetical protein